jgi:Pyridine nucleotide-disulphide oxidoreductase
VEKVQSMSSEMTLNCLQSSRRTERDVVPVAVIGAGPYGLSIGAHLRDRKIPFRIFGRPMESWRRNMPDGMLLKSEGFASSLSDPAQRSTLGRYCAQNGLPYAETGQPISLDTISGYGGWFQSQEVPDLEETQVEAVEAVADGFQLRLNNGERFRARRVVVATGLNYFPQIPEQLRHLSPEVLSHSGANHDLRPFQGRDVTILGAGSSALDIAALLHESGVRVRLVARASSLKFHTIGPARTAWQKIRSPLSGIGPGWRSCFCTDAPMAFRHLPVATRLHIVRTHLGPSGAWWMKDRIVGQVPMLTGCTVLGATMQRGRVRLELNDTDGQLREVVTDHVIAATGYKVDVQRLSFLSEGIRTSVQTVQGAPVLSANFGSSVRGLYFVGLASAFCYGPVMRFICGARYAAQRLARHLEKEVHRYPDRERMLQELQAS